MNAPDGLIAVNYLTPAFAAPPQQLERVTHANIDVGKHYLVGRYTQAGTRFTRWDIVKVTAKEAGNRVTFEFIKESKPGTDPIEWEDPEWHGFTDDVYDGELPPQEQPGYRQDKAYFKLGQAGGRRRQTRHNKRRGSRRTKRRGSRRHRR